MSRVRLGLKVVEYHGDGEIIIRQRVKILDDEGNLIKAPVIEVREKRGRERVEETRARAERRLERTLKDLEEKIMKCGGVG